MKTEKMEFPKTIWLAGWCGECDRGGRENWCWCEECGAQPRKYILATERRTGA